ncbi:MAG: hypothetical protein RIT24_2990, partial [Planctomycetota bacterium]
MSEAPDFVHLRTRSHYSLLGAPVEVKDLVKAAAADGQKAIALTDNGNLFGAIEFYKSCKELGVRSVIGQTTFCAAKTRKQTAGGDNPTFDLTLLAETNEGLDNLRTLSSLAYLEGFSYRPRVDLDLLREHSKGLLCLSGSTHGWIGQCLQQNDGAAAVAAAGQLRDLFGEGRFFLEVGENGSEVMRAVAAGKREVSKRTGIPCVATNDVHYLKPDDWLAHDIMLCIRGGKTVADQDRFRMPSRELYLKSRAEMAKAFDGWLEPLQQTVAIAERCSVDIKFGVYHLPVFTPDTGETMDAFFVRRCKEGARMRYGDVNEAIQQRLDYEITV